jgi:hypothetical protein
MKASEQKTLSYLKKHNKYQKKEWDLVSVKSKILACSIACIQN